MEPTTAATIAASTVRPLRAKLCRPGERIALGYFLYTGVLASLHSLSLGQRLLAWLLPLSLWVLAVVESRFSRPWSRVLRQWAALGLILVGYWQVDWFRSAPLIRWQEIWIGWDRALLDQFGLRAAIEIFGPLLPSALELIYLLLYAVPPACLAVLYLNRRTHRADRFFVTFFLGAFCAYALLPHFPTEAPRVAFPGADLPSFAGVWSSINVWLQEHLDISTSVFPSGHVAVAFSAAFGMWRALPEKRWVWSCLFFVATAVFVATIYCRYHYAADGLVSLGLALAAWRLSEIVDRDE